MDDGDARDANRRGIAVAGGESPARLAMTQKGGPKPASSTNQACRAALPPVAPALAVLAAATAVAPLAPGRTALGQHLLGLALGARDLLTGDLVDDLHGEAHLAAVVEAQELDVDLLALLDHLAHRLGPALGELGDVDEPVLLAEEVHERAELHDLHDLALVDRADLGLRRDGADARQRRLDRLALGGCDLDGAVVLDVHLGPALGHDLADHRAARADHLADLVHGDLDGLDARGVLAELGARACDGLRHLAQDVHAPGIGLVEGHAHDLLGDAGDLDVHLQRGDALLGARHLEVHVAQMVLVAQDVGEHGEAVALLDEPHGDAGNRTLERDAGIHQGERGAAHRGHRRGAVRLGDLGDNAQGVGELLRARQQRMHRAPGELAVANLTPAGRAHAASLAHRERREVVVQEEALLARTLQGVDELLVLAGAQRGDHDGLRLAAREHRRAVGARQYVDFRGNGPHRGEVAAVDTAPRADDVAAHDLLLQALEDSAQQHLLVGVGIGRQQLLRDALLDGVDHLVALLLLHLGKGLAQIGLGQGLHLVRVLGLVGRPKIPRLLGGLLGQADDGLDDRLEAALAEDDGLQHLRLGKLLGLRLHHHHGIAGTGDHEVEVALCHLVDHRVEHELSVDDPNARGADRAQKRHARQRERRRGGHQGHDVGVVLHVVREHGDNDLGLVLEAFHEQRPDRPVDQARGERLLLARPALALEKAAGNLAGGVGPLLVIDGEREEADAGAQGLLRHHGGQNARLAVLGEDGGAGLAGNAARLKAELASAPFNLYTLRIEHFGSRFLFLTAPSGQPPYVEAGRRLQQHWLASAADSQPLDDFLIAGLVATLDVIEKPAAQADHLEQAAPRMVVLLVGLEVIGQSVDALGEERHLDLGRPGVALLGCVFPDYFLLSLYAQRHRIPFLGVGSRPRAVAGMSSSSGRLRCCAQTAASRQRGRVIHQFGSLARENCLGLTN